MLLHTVNRLLHTKKIFFSWHSNFHKKKRIFNFKKNFNCFNVIFSSPIYFIIFCILHTPKFLLTCMKFSTQKRENAKTRNAKTVFAFLTSFLSFKKSNLKLLLHEVHVVKPRIYKNGTKTRKQKRINRKSS